MRRFILPGLVAVAAVALLALLAFGVGGQNAASSIDAQLARGQYPVAPSLDAKLPVLGSKATTSLAAYHGKVVVLNVFASWCPPCKAEAPILAHLQSTLKAHNATVLGVTFQDNPSASEQFVQQQHIDYPVVRDVSGDFARSWGTYQVPETFIINRQGHVQALQRSQLTNGAWLRTQVAKVLGEPS